MFGALQKAGRGWIREGVGQKGGEGSGVTFCFGFCPAISLLPFFFICDIRKREENVVLVAQVHY